MSETPSEPIHASGEATRPASLDTLAGGRYVLGRQLGAGGMGVVCRATDRLLDREVAVKLLADNLAADRDARERFLREARAAARIGDPHVVAVYDVGEEGGRPYLVMELVDGPSLADVIQRSGPLDPAEVEQVAAGALAGLLCAHRAGLLHRDVKPGNLLQAPDGTVKVTDFGVVQAAGSPGLTQTGMVIGTRSFLAPERRSGQPATAATDLYALGVTLTQLLTGRIPDLDEGPAVPPATPDALRRLIQALLAHDPQDRPASAADALAMIGAERPARRRAVASAGGRPDDDGATAVLATEESTVASPTRSEHWADASVRRPAARLGLMVVAGLAVAVVAALGLSGINSPDPDSDPPAQPAGEVTQVEGDPGGTARNLAEWLRQQGED